MLVPIAVMLLLLMLVVIIILTGKIFAMSDSIVGFQKEISDAQANIRCLEIELELLNDQVSRIRREARRG